MRIVMTNVEATQLREPGGVLLPCRSAPVGG
jgi:hypothetical protein